MVRQHSPDGTVAGFQRAVLKDPDGTEGQVYRRWMVEVLQPLNERASKIVRDRIDLLDTPKVEPLLLQLVAHVAAYKVILSRSQYRLFKLLRFAFRWSEGDVTTEVVVLSYPDRLVDYVRTEFARLKRLQASLIGHRSRM